MFYRDEKPLEREKKILPVAPERSPLSHPLLSVCRLFLHAMGRCRPGSGHVDVMRPGKKIDNIKYEKRKLYYEFWLLLINEFIRS